MRLNLLLISAGTMAVLMTSCSYIGSPGGTGPTPSQGTQGEGSETVSSEEQKNMREAQESAEDPDALGPEEPGPTVPGGPRPNTDTNDSEHPYATKIPGKEGFVFNPFTNNPVDVRGIPSGTLVRDPQDPDESHKFRVP